MTRFGQDPSALPPAVEEEEAALDSLFERWLARSNRSQPRMRTSAPPTIPPLGDDLADSWFK
jgi:hypothetical protein